MKSIYLVMIIFTSCYYCNKNNGNQGKPDKKSGAKMLNNLSALMGKALSIWTKKDIDDFITIVQDIPFARGFVVNFFKTMIYHSQIFERLKRENKWTRLSCVNTFLGTVTETFQEFYFSRENSHGYHSTPLKQCGVMTETTHNNSSVKYCKCINYLEPWTDADYLNAKVENRTAHDRTISELAKHGISKNDFCEEVSLIYEIRCGFTQELFTRLKDANKFKIPIMELKFPKFKHRGVGFKEIHSTIINIMAYAIDNLDRVEVMNSGEKQLEFQTSICR